MDAKETSLYTAVLIVSIVLGTIIIYFIISIVRQHRRSLQLYKKSIHTEITTLEKERVRMAADLHDEVGPVLSSIKLRIGSVDVLSDEDQQEIEKTSFQIDNLIKRMREISFDLMPNSLIRKGLPEALNEFIDNCSKSGDLNIKFNYEPVSLTQQQSINLYRIIQEVIHNTRKHAKARNLQIELKKEKQLMVLATNDDGVGFNYHDKVKEGGGMGLHNLLSRTEMMGGKMFVDSKRGKGTTYIFEIPMAPN
jgi:two-component system, NarL family, sensor kinase